MVDEPMVKLRSIDGRVTTECAEKYAKALEASGKYVRVPETKKAAATPKDSER